MAVESKLQDPCPGDAELVTEGGNVRRDQAQILSDEGQYA